MRKKGRLFVALACILLVIVFLLVKFFNHGLDTPAFATFYDPSIGFAPAKSVFLDDYSSINVCSDGSLYELSKYGVLYHHSGRKEVVAYFVKQMQPYKNGVVYIKDSNLIFFHNGENTLIAKDVNTFCCNASTVFYFLDNKIFAWIGGSSEYIFAENAKDTTLLANEKWLIQIDSAESLAYSLDYNNQVQFRSSSDNYRCPYILCGDTLYDIGYPGRVKVISLAEGAFEEKYIDLPWITWDALNNIRMAYTGKGLYLSISANTIEGFSSLERAGTIYVDLKTWNAVVLEDIFYEALLCDSCGHIFGYYRSWLMLQ